MFDLAATFTGVSTDVLSSITIAYLPEGSLTLLPAYIQSLASRKGITLTFESSEVTLTARKNSSSDEELYGADQTILSVASEVATTIASKTARCTPPSSWTLLSWTGKKLEKLEKISFSRIGKGLFSAFLVYKDKSGEKISYLTLKMRISCEKPVLIAKKLVRYGEKLRPEDVEIKNIDVMQILGTPASTEDAYYAPVLRTLRPGEVVTLEKIRRKPDVLKGQILLAYVVLPGVHVSTMVEAIEDGYIGDVLRVKNLSSGKILRGIVEEGPVIRILEVER